MNSTKIGELLKERRNFLNLNQEDLAEMSGINKKTIQQVEMGKGNPSLETLEKMAAVLGMEVLVQIKNLNHG